MAATSASTASTPPGDGNSNKREQLKETSSSSKSPSSTTELNIRKEMEEALQTSIQENATEGHENDDIWKNLTTYG